MKKKKFNFVTIVNKKKIIQFANLTKDFHPLHSNINFAKKNGFKNIVAHGLLISSICSAIMYKFFGNSHFIISQSFEYMKPVYLGEKIKIHGVYSLKNKLLKLKEIEVKVKKNNELKSRGTILIRKF